MAAKNKFMNAMKMPAIADMFSSEADRQRESGDLVTEVPLAELHPFVNHPFEVRDDEDMQKLVDSIRLPSHLNVAFVNHSKLSPIVVMLDLFKLVLSSLVAEAPFAIFTLLPIVVRLLQL